MGGLWGNRSSKERALDLPHACHCIGVQDFVALLIQLLGTYNSKTKCLSSKSSLDLCIQCQPSASCGANKPKLQSPPTSTFTDTPPHQMKPLQVPQRTCVLTAANTSDVSQLPGSDPTAASASSFSAIKTDNPVTTYSIMPYNTDMGRKHRRTRRSLLGSLSATAQGWLHLDHDEAAAAVVQAVTHGPGSAGHVRKMLQEPTAAPAATAGERELISL